MKYETAQSLQQSQSESDRKMNPYASLSNFKSKLFVKLSKFFGGRGMFKFINKRCIERPSETVNLIRQ